MPTKNSLTLQILEHTAAIRILVFIYNNNDKAEGVHLSEVIRGVVASSDTIQKTVDYLIANSLVKDEYTKVHPYRRMLTLTPL